MVKRDARRARKRIEVRYGTEKADRTAFTKDISDTGLRLRTNTVLVAGTKLRIELEFPDRVFGMWGRVEWARKVPARLTHTLECGMGISFVDPPADWKPFYEAWRAGK